MGIAEEEAAYDWVHCMLVVMREVQSGSAGQELRRLQVAPAKTLVLLMKQRLLNPHCPSVKQEQ
ncbi:hypothetical protein GBF38_022177, partial [Nibea albiflora]